MEINGLSLEELTHRCCDIASKAGEYVVDIYTKGFDVEKKADNSPVTSADMVSHYYLVEKLQELSPSLPILSEESSAISYDERSKWDIFWLIDPLDGTREFIKGNDEFTINIALIKNHAPLLGVIHVPATKVTYYASLHMGAYKQTGDHEAIRIKTRHPIPQIPTVCGSRSHSSKSFAAFLERLGEHKLLSVGSSIKSCIVAEGIADIYPRYGSTSEWDTAAAQCIVEEAGGVLTDMKLHPLQYNRRESLVNPPFVVIGKLSERWRQIL